MRTAIYTRVSTTDQDLSMQRREISLFMQSKGITGAKEYPDKGYSGKNDSRPELKALKNDIKQGAIELLIVYKLDRVARSLSDLLGFLKLCEENKVKFISVKDNIDLTTPQGVLMMQLLGAFAEFERTIIVDRVKSGMASAKARGIRLGPPLRIGNEIKAKVMELRAQGLSYMKIALATNISPTTAHAIIKNERKTL